MQIATFGAGCFWQVEAEFSKVKGVVKTAVGFMGGDVRNPTYEEVCNGGTGHIEVCQVEFGEKVISYEKLLDVFWQIHNPTTPDRQGTDVGEQYRSMIFYYSEEQKKTALQSRKEAQKKFDNKIVTEIKKADKFYLAEEYHQRYLEKNK